MLNLRTSICALLLAGVSLAGCMGEQAISHRRASSLGNVAVPDGEVYVFYQDGYRVEAAITLQTINPPETIEAHSGYGAPDPMGFSWYFQPLGGDQRELPTDPSTPYRLSVTTGWGNGWITLMDDHKSVVMKIWLQVQGTAAL